MAFSAAEPAAGTSLTASVAAAGISMNRGGSVRINLSQYSKDPMGLLRGLQALVPGTTRFPISNKGTIGPALDFIKQYSTGTFTLSQIENDRNATGFFVCLAARYTIPESRFAERVTTVPENPNVVVLYSDSVPGVARSQPIGFQGYINTTADKAVMFSDLDSMWSRIVAKMQEGRPIG